jgi:hypothetical protein
MNFQLEGFMNFKVQGKPPPRTGRPPKDSLGPALVRDGANGFASLLRPLAADRRLTVESIRAGFPATVLRDAGNYSIQTMPLMLMSRFKLSGHSRLTIECPSETLGTKELPDADGQKCRH